MTKAVKCLACGLYYNGQVYNECPHCKAKQEPDKETEKALNQRGNTAKIDTPDINEEQNPKVNKDDPPQKQKRYTVPTTEYRREQSMRRMISCLKSKRKSNALKLRK